MDDPNNSRKYGSLLQVQVTQAYQNNMSMILFPAHDVSANIHKGEGAKTYRYLDKGEQ